MSKKILVVDDEEDIASVLLVRLGTHGYDTASASTGSQALELVKHDKFDLIILDILMPDMNGTEVAQILRDDPKTKDIPIIFLTALGTQQEGPGYSISGSSILFAKPYDPIELMTKIDELLN